MSTPVARDPGPGDNMPAWRFCPSCRSSTVPKFSARGTLCRRCRTDKALEDAADDFLEEMDPDPASSRFAD